VLRAGLPSAGELNLPNLWKHPAVKERTPPAKKHESGPDRRGRRQLGLKRALEAAINRLEQSEARQAALFDFGLAGNLYEGSRDRAAKAADAFGFGDQVERYTKDRSYPSGKKKKSPRTAILEDVELGLDDLADPDSGAASTEAALRRTGLGPDAELALRQLWRLAEGHPDELVVVGPDTRRRKELPTEEAAEYSSLEFLGDKDSILEVCVQLARTYPGCQITRLPSSRLPREARVKPLVVVGGPVGEEGLGGNELAAELIDYLELPISYSEDCDTMRFSDDSFGSEYKTTGIGKKTRRRLVKDCGLIARLTNPWSTSARILMFQGNHTVGVLGAVRALSSVPQAWENSSEIVSRFGQDPLFVAPCTVPIPGGTVVPPLVDQSRLTSLRSSAGNDD
jgi:hypothetical protein